MPRLRFVKMHGSGNDFVVIDNRLVGLKLAPLSIERLCRRPEGIGADGLLLLEKGDLVHYRMRYFNADGGEVEMCGNGARCIGYFIYILEGKKSFPLQTGAGLIEVEIVGENYVKISMPEPEDFRLNFSLPNLEGVYNFVIVGVPHLVIFTDKLDSLDIVTLARPLRYSFIEGGTNVDFVEIVDPNTLRIRTYERGVEDETLSCGTGATASALIAGKLGFVNSPVKVLVRYPEPLTITFNSDFSHPALSGPVSVSFVGEIEI